MASQSTEIQGLLQYLSGTALDAQGAINALAAAVDAASGSGTTGLVDKAVVRRTAGSVTLNSTAWANVDTGMDLVLTASSGDYVEVTLCGFLDQTGATYVRFDVASIVSAAVVNTWSENGAEHASSEGVPGWTGIASAFTPISGTTGRVLVAGDISAATVTLRLRYRTDSAVNRILNAAVRNQLVFMARNYGPIT